MRLSENELAVDPEGVVDEPANSIFAAGSAVFGILGLFAILATSFSIACLISFLLGLIVLAFSRRWNLSRASIGIATASIYMSLFCGFAGVTNYWSRQVTLHQKAYDVAITYMNTLARGDRTTAIQMAGLPPMVEDADLDSKEVSREQQAVRRFLNDPIIQEVIERGTEASWKATSILSETRQGVVIEMIIRIVDRKSTNPQPYEVTVRFVPPMKYAVENVNRWIIDSIYRSSR